MTVYGDGFTTYPSTRMKCFLAVVTLILDSSKLACFRHFSLHYLCLYRVVEVWPLEPKFKSFQVFPVSDSFSICGKFSNCSRNSRSIILNGQVKHIKPFGLPNDVSGDKHRSLRSENCCFIKRPPPGKIGSKIVSAREPSASKQRFHCPRLVTIHHQRPRISE